ncbi:alpha-galactosidase [Haloactinopolyspora alba]|uniref:Alpha-galactosidase n=2 Tax=Haloactinopolyspora alba TaxID=648780 RepID=A0A2P8DKV8_9ACTN|nr:glycoside hydrolase family 36 protein [Haloactinopolyspora alba]PSK97865.1 alpha-galactosidase [Haloactinopolyspora alba]
MSPHPHRVVWGHSALTLVVVAEPDGPARLVRLDPADVTEHDGPAGGSAEAETAQPLAEVLLAGDGHAWSGARSIETIVGARLRFSGSRADEADGWRRLVVELTDPETGIGVEVWFRSVDGVPAVQAWTRVSAGGSGPVVLHAVSSLVTGAFAAGASADDVDVSWAESDWLAEGRWQRRALRDAGVPDIDLGTHRQNPRGAMVVTSHGSWSSGEYLPTGVLHDRSAGRAWAWQIEHNGAWRWEVGEGLDGVYVALSGPRDADHQWRHALDPGDEFVSVPVGIAVGDDGAESALAALTAYRRCIVRPDDDHVALPVVFNDYMNTLMGDPTTQKLLPLIDAAASAGAEYFCIDAGWYDDDGDWWDSVGAWEPSTTRFCAGLGEVVERIRSAGMSPGLWLEPEVVGVRSRLADELPDDAFFQRDGRRQIENGRYHLDLRHPAAVAHLDATVDRLVGEFGIRYFKLDYNINPGAGTDAKDGSAGAGLMEHNRAHLRWLEGVLDRHPGLVLENCGSGAMRMDYAMLARLQLQSTSDQQNPLLYPPIAASAPMSVLPEQSASWAYPQPEMSDEEIAFTMCTGMLGRLYLSGHLDRMDTGQLELVRRGVEVHREIRADLARAVPFWPLELPGWNDRWISLGLRSGDVTYLGVWRRPHAEATVQLPIAHLRGTDVDVDVIYPDRLPAWEHTWDRDDALLRLTGAADPPAARIVRIRPTT